MNTKLYDISDWCKKGAMIEDYPYIGEVDIELSIGEVVKVEKDYFTAGVLNHANKSAGVRRVNIDFEPKDKEYEHNLTCPYCGYEYGDSWELSDDYEDKYECGRCGAIISYERVVTVEYNSSPVKPPEVITAKWL